MDPRPERALPAVRREDFFRHDARLRRRGLHRCQRRHADLHQRARQHQRAVGEVNPVFSFSAPAGGVSEGIDLTNRPASAIPPAHHDGIVRISCGKSRFDAEGGSDAQDAIQRPWSHQFRHSAVMGRSAPPRRLPIPSDALAPGVSPAGYQPPPATTTTVYQPAPAPPPPPPGQPSEGIAPPVGAVPVFPDTAAPFRGG